MRYDRLRTVLPKLQGRLAAALGRERHERWDAEYNRIRSKRDAGAARLARARELTDHIIGLPRNLNFNSRSLARSYESTEMLVDLVEKIATQKSD